MMRLTSIPNNSKVISNSANRSCRLSASVLAKKLNTKDEKAEAITELCNRIKCPKKYEQLAKLVNKTYQFATNFDTQSSDAKHCQSGFSTGQGSSFAK
jgi:hypothetical protein